MSDVRPHGAMRDAQYGFSRVFVHDLDAMAAFYEEVRRPLRAAVRSH